ncbi:MAG: hypothetical protein NT150_15010 [Bacteroidetes bacterium]|nr:hypothetical protein [Bacteroidota bacterium]
MKKLLLIFFLFLSGANALYAQCSQCKAVAESGLKNGSNLSDMDQSYGRGLNTGILILAVVPYIILAGLVWYFFRKKIKEKFNSIIHRK